MLTGYLSYLVLCQLEEDGGAGAEGDRRKPPLHLSRPPIFAGDEAAGVPDPAAPPQSSFIIYMYKIHYSYAPHNYAPILHTSFFDLTF